MTTLISDKVSTQVRPLTHYVQWDPDATSNAQATSHVQATLSGVRLGCCM